MEDQNILDWILDNCHFTLLKLFEDQELHNLSLVCRKMEDKIGAMLMWREMLNMVTFSLQPMTSSSKSSTHMRTVHALPPSQSTEKELNEQKSEEKAKGEEIKKEETVPVKSKNKSKFGKRFANITQKGMGNIQWIILPEEDLEGCAKIDPTKKNIKESSLHSLNLWISNIQEIISSINKKTPDETLTSEISYWRDINSVLKALTLELEAEYVNDICTILKDTASDQIQCLWKQKEQIQKAFREADWNNKYLSIMEKPVKILNFGNLNEISIAIKPMMSSLNNIYESSKFYKESRIVSFVNKILLTIRHRFSDCFKFIPMLAEIKRSKLYLEEQIGPQLDIAKEIITKLNDNFFPREFIRPKELNEFGTEKFKNNPATKESAPKNIDFINFDRPQTACVHSSHLMMTRTATAFNFPHKERSLHWGAARRQILNDNKKLVWFERVAIMEKEIEYISEVIDNLLYSGNVIFRLEHQFIPIIKDKLICKMHPFKEANCTKLLTDMQTFINLYTEEPLNYHIFEYTSSPNFRVLMNNVEKDGMELEERFEQIMLEIERGAGVVTFKVTNLGKKAVKKRPFSQMSGTTKASDDENKEKEKDEEDTANTNSPWVTMPSFSIL